MGFDAQAIDRMSLWQFLAAQGGYMAANGGSKEPGLSDDEFNAIAEIV